MKNVDNKTPINIIEITSHPSKPQILNSLAGTSGGNGLQDFGQSYVYIFHIISVFIRKICTH